MFQVLELTGLKTNQLEMGEDVLNILIKSYCRESGVRNLRKQLEKIHRKAAFRIVSDDLPSVAVTPDNLSEFVGKPVYLHDKMYHPTTPAGVCMGLAWTAHGGSTLYVETVRQRVRTEGANGNGGGGAGGRIEFTGEEIIEPSCQHQGII